jgi:hypothetical protein
VVPLSAYCVAPGSATPPGETTRVPDSDRNDRPGTETPPLWKSSIEWQRFPSHPPGSRKGLSATER